MTNEPSAAPPAPAAAPRPRWRRALLQSALVAVLWPSLMVFPGAPEAGLDASWQLLLIHAYAEGWQFGRELVFTWGPWGFLNGHYHLGDTGAAAKLAWETAGRLVLAVAIVRLSATLVAWRQVVVVAGLALAGWLFVDTAFYLAIALLVGAGLLRPGGALGERVAWGLLLAFLSCLKFTYLVVAAGGVALAVAACAGRREFRAGAATGLAYAGGFVAWWAAAGQHPDHIWPYLVRSLELTSGYGDAMGVEEPRAVFAWGAGLLAAGAAYLVGFLRRHPDRVAAWSTALFLGALGLVVWKGSFTRADGHVFGFFLFAGLAGVALPGLCEGGRRPHWLDLSLVAALCGIAAFESGLLERIPRIGVARIAANYAALPKVPRMPEGWRQARAAAEAAHALPRLRAIIGRGTVDVFHHEAAVALLNGLALRTRPIFQSYSAYTPRLAWRNWRFYRTPETAPEFVLWRHQTIDGRFPTQDDALLAAELGRGYAPVAEEGGFLLLRRLAPLPAERSARRLLHERSVPLGEDVAVPASAPHPLWLQVELRLSRLGRLRALLYKPPQAHLVTTDSDGAQRTWRLLPRVAADGFLLDPVLETQADFAAYLGSRGARTVRSVRLEVRPEDREFFAIVWELPVVRFWALTDLVLEATGRFAPLVAAGVFATEPAAVASPHPLEIHASPAGPVVQVHAPAELRFPVPAGARTVTGRFGLRDGAHVGDSATDGVRFTLALEGPDGAALPLWERALDPVRQGGDRGPQTFAVDLPASAGATLVLRALPGSDDRSDWSYFGGVAFASPPSRP